MPIPWLRLLNTAVGVADFALTRRSGERTSALARRSGALGLLETRLAGVVVSALKEAFDRDSRRIEFEREQAEAQRQRAERALRLELVRQAGERELGRLRLLVGIALLGWIGTLFLSGRVMGGPIAARVLLVAGWVALLGALAAALQGYTAAAKTLARVGNLTDPLPESIEATTGGAAASWLIIAGFALTGLAALVAL
jgi:hypothetical protein